MVAGDVVESLFPYTDLSDAKARPVLVLRDVGMGDWIVCEITTRLSRRRPRTIALSSSDFSQGGLPRPSVARFDRLHVINDRVFAQNPYGHLTALKLNEILTQVRNLF